MALGLEDYEYTKKIAKRIALFSFLTKFPRFTWLLLKLISPFMHKARWYNAPIRFLWGAGGAGRKSVYYLKGLNWWVNAGKDYFNMHLSAAQNDTQTVWIMWDISPEPIWGLGLTPVTPEWPVAFLPVVGPEFSINLLQMAEADGMTEDICSATKAAEAAALTRQLPRPAAIITATQPCDSVQAAYQLLAQGEDVPIFCLDLPYRRSEADFQYFTDNVRNMISFLEKATDRKMDYERLRSVLEETNKTNQYLLEVCEMNRAIPCPSTLMELLAIWALNTVSMGHPMLTKFAGHIHKETKKRFKAGKPGGPNPEKIRIVWHDVPISFMPIIQWLEKKFGAYIVADMIGYKNMHQVDTTDKETMIRGIAELYLGIAMGRHFHGDLGLYLGEIDRFVAEYKPDCFIFALHRGCKQSWAIRRLLKNKANVHNLPVLVIEADIFDTRYKGEQQIKDQIEEFFISSGLA